MAKPGNTKTKIKAKRREINIQENMEKFGK